MDTLSLDPYEQQLLTVFDSCDHENLGSLNKDGLVQLCQALHLEEQCTDLIQSLLQDPKHSRATFSEFKEALLTLLGNMQLNKTKHSDESSKKVENGSPDREVSPKFIYGSKKYGRRSRPRSDEISTVDEQNDLNYLNKSTNVSVQRSNSQSEVSNSKKRKTNYKLKRCTSLPGPQRIENNFVTNSLNNEAEIVYTEEMLREAWKKLGVGKDGYLNQTELVLVCDAIGLHKLAKGVIRQLSGKANLDYNHKISFQELLEALQLDETWSEVLNSPPANDLTLTAVSNEIFPDSRTFQYVALGPDGNGVINTETLIEMWEQVGISSPKELVHELGFNDREINIVDLATVLEKEVKGIHDSSRADVQNPHIALLNANLTLYQTEIKCLKHILEQMHAEREKLKCDVHEANNRANLLAQEVDDNHLKMERNTQNQVKLMEQRHADILKEITQQYASDKEHLSLVNQSLEEKIYSLEQEVNKLKSDLIVAQKYSNSIERENHNLSTQISELQQVKNVLTDQINTLECEKQKYVEMEQEQIEPLLAKLSSMQLENAQLRDRNDEMVAEIENLTCQVSNMRTKVTSTPSYSTLDQCMDENISVICEGVGLGAKRRSDYSPTKDTVLFGIADGSPRLGKVRKFHKDRPDHLEVVPFASNESGFEAEIDGFDSSLSVSTNEQEEITRLQAKVAFLEQILAQHSIPFPNDNVVENATSGTITDLKARIQELEKLFNNLHDVSKMINKNGLNGDNLKSVGEKLEMILSHHKNEKMFTESSTETDTSSKSIEETIKEYEEQNEMLQTKCSELENCVELLRNEYEKCEDYWQSKLDEERQIFEQEQCQSSEKLSDLINKMAEYEEQFANQDAIDNRLPPIEETYNLEKQFTDLEQEFEDYKAQSENELFKRDEEISILKQKLTELAVKQKCSDISVQVNDFDENTRINNKMNTLSLCMVESTNLFSADAMPVAWSPDSSKRSEKEFDSNFVWNKESKSEENSSATSLSWQNGGGQPSTSNSSTLEKNAPCRPKRTRKHDRNNCLYKKNSQDMKKNEDVFPMREEQVVTLPVSAVHGLNGRLHHLEQRCRQLQMVLKQQHFYTEQALQQCRQHHRGEKAELQCVLRSHQEKLDQQVRMCNDQLERLARSDMLVKELYVENSYLIAKVQRLEQQCHILAQCNSNISV